MEAEPKAQRVLETLDELKRGVLDLIEVEPPPPVRLAEHLSRRIEPISPEKRPWEGLDPYDKPDSTFKLRLNPYQRSLLGAVSKKQVGSQHAAAVRLLVAAMERELGLR